jgi:hypothetical protein
VFYRTFLVLFYVLIPQKVTVEGLPEKRAKNHAKNGQKSVQKLVVIICNNRRTLRLCIFDWRLPIVDLRMWIADFVCIRAGFVGRIGKQEIRGIMAR